MWKVFQEFEAPDYPQEGSMNSDGLSTADGENDYRDVWRLRKGKLLGVIATRSEGGHIALFSFKKEIHSQGIGQKVVRLYRPAL